MPRLFVALQMPDEVDALLDRLCTGLPGVRWSGEYHLTLRFVGEVDHSTFYEIGEILGAISHPPFDLTLKGVGCFPPRGDPQTLWAGVAPSEGMSSLRRRVERMLREVGVGTERRSFVPHVTLGRVDSPLPGSRFGTWLARRSLFTSPSFPVSGFTLYSSVLRPDGAEHQVEATYDFVTGVMERV